MVIYDRLTYTHRHTHSLRQKYSCITAEITSLVVFLFTNEKRRHHKGLPNLPLDSNKI